jgi:hypothetical protein
VRVGVAAVSPNPNNGVSNQIAGIATTQIFAGESSVSEYTGEVLTFRRHFFNFG